MLCPKCHAETSDVTNTCVWCGATLDWAASPPYTDPYAAAQNRRSPDDPFADQTQAPGDHVPPGDASFQDHGPTGRPVSEWPPPDAGRHLSHHQKKQWYLTAWPYLVAVLIVIAFFSFLLLRGGGAGAFPKLVVGGTPTLLNVYSDT